MSRAKSNHLLKVFAAGVIVLALLGGFWLVVLALDDPSTSSEPGASKSAPRRLSELAQRVDEVESAVTLPSAKWLSQPRYGSSAEFRALVERDQQKVSPLLVEAVAGLERDVLELAAPLQQRATELAAQPTSPDAPGPDALSPDQQTAGRECRDQRLQLQQIAARVGALRRALNAPRGTLDAAVIAELRHLEEMERAVAVTSRPMLSASAIQRATELLGARNEKLAWLALNALARAPDPVATQAALARIDALSPAEQAQLVWSLLVSGQPAAIAAALQHLDQNAALLGRLDREQVATLIETDPDRYQNVLPRFVAACRTTEERWRYFRLQAAVFNDAWSDELLQACRAGLLRERESELLAEIITQRRHRAYPLAERLLDGHRRLSPRGITPAQFETLVTVSRPLAARVGEQLLLFGDETQRRAMLPNLCDPQGVIAPVSVRQRIERDRPAELAALLNELLAQAHPRALDLAEFILATSRSLDREQVPYAAASPESLSRPQLRRQIFELAVGAGPAGVTWVVEQLLGVAFSEGFHAAEAARLKQQQTILPANNVLGGKLVTLRNLGVSALQDRGLAIAGAQILRLPKDIDPAEWSRDGAHYQNLLQLRERLAEVRRSPDDAFAPAALARVEAYVAQLFVLADACADLSAVYDLTITKQLPGVLREMKTRLVESWEFRFTADNIATFQREQKRFDASLVVLQKTRGEVPLAAAKVKE